MFPSFSELFNEFKAKFKQARPDVDPSIKGSWPFAFGRGVAAIGYSLVILAKELLKQFNPLTATGNFLELWASYDGISRLGASLSVGNIQVYGLNGVIIPSDTFWAGRLNGLLYSNVSAASIQTQDIDQIPITILTLTQVANLVTATCSFPHSLLAGSSVTVSGADQSDYNGNFEVTPSFSDPFVFTYITTGLPVTPATGSPYSAIPIRTLVSLSWLDDVVSAETAFAHGFVDQQYVFISDTDNANYDGFFLITIDLTVPDGDKKFTFGIIGDPGVITDFGLVRSVHALVSVQSEDTGVATVIAGNGLLDMQDPQVVGSDPIANSPGGLQGGAPQESDDSLRARMLLSRSTQRGVFTNDQIELAAKLINGNTDVFIQNPNTIDLTDPNAVLPGQVRVYILRKNDPFGPIPTGGILEITKISIVENAGLPADVWLEDLFVLAPKLTPILITMTNVLPDTATMKQAIKSQFEAYFTDEAQMGVDLDNDILRATAKDTQDLSSGLPEESFITSFDWTDIRLRYIVSSVADNGAGKARFSFTPGPILITGQQVFLNNFTGASVSISNVVDDGGNAEFSFTPGPTLQVGREVVISGFITNPTYNGTFTISAVGVGTFKIGLVPFTGSEVGVGSFIPTYNGPFNIDEVGPGFFDIDLINFIGDQTGTFDIETESLSRSELPILGILTVNGQVIS